MQKPNTPSSTIPTPTISARWLDLIEWADLKTGKGPVYSLAWSPDGQWLATADFDQILLWDTATRQEAGIFTGHTSFIWGVAWSPASTPLTLASASQDGSVRLWDATMHTQTALLDTGWAFCVDWSPDGKLLAVGTNNNGLQVWDVSEQKLMQTWESPTGTPIISLAWSPDGMIIASGELGGDINLWQATTGELLQTLTGYTNMRHDVNGLDWSPDGKILASANQDGKVRMWEAETFELTRTIVAHSVWARGLAFSPNGLLLASTGGDMRICLWDVATGQEYAEQHHNSLPVWSASWSPDGKYVSSGAGAYEQPHVGATIIWQVP